jgi:hypothetical protein
LQPESIQSRRGSGRQAKRKRLEPQGADGHCGNKKKEITLMFLGLEWYWWLVILAVLAISVPCKVKFMKWWARQEKSKKKEQRGKWGDEE